mmetsp:Transcript_23734/g.67041  ORF Transcript_23734/g.67041 Transcript_23734/m.67041 type:complete len:202 (-) Transcript_23734:973-1578(-)
MMTRIRRFLQVGKFTMHRFSHEVQAIPQLLLQCCTTRRRPEVLLAHVHPRAEQDAEHESGALSASHVVHESKLVLADWRTVRRTIGEHVFVLGRVREVVEIIFPAPVDDRLFQQVHAVQRLHDLLQVLRFAAIEALRRQAQQQYLRFDVPPTIDAANDPLRPLGSPHNPGQVHLMRSSHHALRKDLAEYVDGLLGWLQTPP